MSTPETLIRLSVTPAPAPKPSLRYRLLPELKDLNPGNPIQGYMKCMMEQQRFFFDREAFQRRDKLLLMPLEEVPAQELEEYGRSALSQADRAARLDSPDWQILLKLKADGINTLLPDVQQIRSLARALQVRMRSEVAQGWFDDALRTAQTLFAMTRHLGEHPTLIGDLVGIAIAFETIGPLEEMLEQPGCPNLYWALATLPTPLVPLDKGMEGERMIVRWVFRDLDENAPMSADQLKKSIAHLDELLAIVAVTSTKPRMRAWLDQRTKDERKVSAARRRLVESGLPEERLRRFPADQVMMLDEKRELDVRHDDLTKTMGLPVWQGDALAAQISRSYTEPALFADAVVPLTYTVRKAQARLDQRIALLRQVEALRLHAAEHNGTLPAKLSEVSVPLADDPITGKPFRYELKGGTAHFRGSPPSGEEKNADFNIHYEVTLQK